jgi:SNF2 family DNA or RNA helicase
MEQLRENFEFPFEPQDFQVEAVDEIVSRDCSLLKFEVGLGKTFCSTLAALKYSLEDGIEQILVLCPPVLLDQWYEFLMQIKGIPSICLYRGTPKERRLMELEESVILVSYNIFRGKQDYSKFVKLGKTSKLCVIADELSLKNLQSQTYRKIKMLMYWKMRVGLEDIPKHKLIALNATPISDLGQVYNWCALFIPGVYASKRLFLLAHMDEEDHWGNVTKWKGTKMMERNFDLFTIDTDENIKIPPLIETDVPYTLTKAHYQLYSEVEQAQIDALPEDKMELAINSMFSTLQRLVLLPEEFGLKIKPPILDYIDSYLSQLGDEAVLIYTRHVAVSEMLMNHVPDSAAIYGKVGKTKREQAFADVKSGKIKRLIGNIDSLGVGLNLQMINHVIFVEMPFRSDRMMQSIGRIHRQGQLKTCFAHYPMALDTIQYQIFYKLLRNKEEIGKVLHTKQQVLDFIVDYRK